MEFRGPGRGPLSGDSGIASPPEPPPANATADDSELFQSAADFNFSANRSGLSGPVNTGSFRTPAQRRPSSALQPPSVAPAAMGRSFGGGNSICEAIPEEESAKVAAPSRPLPPPPLQPLSSLEKENRAVKAPPSVFGFRRLSIAGQRQTPILSSGLKAPSISASNLRTPIGAPKPILATSAKSVSASRLPDLPPRPVFPSPMDQGQLNSELSQEKSPPEPSPLPPPPQMPLKPSPEPSQPPPSRLDLGNNTVTVEGKMYKILSKMGSGGSANVFRVLYETKTKNETLAVKVVDLSGEEEAVRESFRKEVAFLQRMQSSPRVIRLLATAEAGGKLFLVMEEGEVDLARHLHERIKNSRDGRPYDHATIRFYWREMLECVAAIHAEGIVHSDLKPANFLFVRGTLKLIDFGIASPLSEAQTSAIVACPMGTISYMSPEACAAASASLASQRPKIRPASDVWSLGIILYSLVYGRTPFSDVKAHLRPIVIQQREIRLPDEPAVEASLRRVLLRCLSKDPEQRPSCAELLADPYLQDPSRPQSLPLTEPAREDLADVSSLIAQIKSSSPATAASIFRRLREANS